VGLTGFLAGVTGAAFCAGVSADADEAACGLRPAIGRHTTTNMAVAKKSKVVFNIAPSSADVSINKHFSVE
jgi:hypothetical protein